MTGFVVVLILTVLALSSMALIIFWHAQQEVERSLEKLVEARRIRLGRIPAGRRR